jgi:hypothetical protein
MDEILMLFAPAILGIAGGLAFALVARFGRAPRRHVEVAAPGLEQGPETDVINIASIKVAGVGGLGLVAMAGAVALDVPMIGAAMGLGLGFGLILAAGLILVARRKGPMPSSGKGIGASTMLALREPAAPPSPPDRRESHDLRSDVILVPAR